MCLDLVITSSAEGLRGVSRLQQVDCVINHRAASRSDGVAVHLPGRCRRVSAAPDDPLKWGFLSSVHAPASCPRASDFLPAVPERPRASVHVLIGHASPCHASAQVSGRVFNTEI